MLMTGAEDGTVRTHALQLPRRLRNPLGKKSRGPAFAAEAQKHEAAGADKGWSSMALKLSHKISAPAGCSGKAAVGDCAVTAIESVRLRRWEHFIAGDMSGNLRVFNTSSGKLRAAATTTVSSPVLSCRCRCRCRCR